MGEPRVRLVLATLAAAAVLGYGLVGHGLSHVTSHEIAGAVATLCLLVATLLGTAAIARYAVNHGPAPRAKAETAPVVPAPGPADRRARASPPVLQRLRN